MGTAAVQGELWGARARDWAEIQEPAWRPVYEALLGNLNVGAGTRLLDIGCGAGGALLAARGRGAQVAGLDASQALVAVARERLPGSRIEAGEMETLPFEDASFDVVTGFNAFQFAGDLGAALREARRVCCPGGQVAMLAWGRKEDCELCAATLPAVLALLPPPPAGQSASAPLSDPGVMESAMQSAGLRPREQGEIDCAFTYPDAATAWRAISSAGMVIRAIRHAGEEAVRGAVLGTLAAFTRPDGSIRQRNRFRWVAATPPGVLGAA